MHDKPVLFKLNMLGMLESLRILLLFISSRRCVVVSIIQCNFTSSQEG
jgi:hypothetical protein